MSYLSVLKNYVSPVKLLTRLKLLKDKKFLAKRSLRQ